jgi:hypothetical protein
MNISGNIYDNHGHSQYVNLWAPDPPQPAPQMPTTHRHLQGLAKAGVFGIIALAVIAIVAGILAILPKPLRIAVILAALAWIVWSIAALPKATAIAETPAPRAELVRVAPTQAEQQHQTLDAYWKEQEKRFRPAPSPSPEVRRATLVNSHPNHH